MYLTPSHKQTKTWRKNQEWYINGKHNECELYQRKLFEKIINKKCNKTNKRFNTNHELLNKKNPMINEDDLEYTENFDGFFKYHENKYYINFKFVCDNGGAQTRTLRETYLFINYQINHIIKYKTYNTYFINILDGDTSSKFMKYFDYLINKKNTLRKKKYIFVGDMYTFKNYWKHILK